MSDQQKEEKVSTASGRPLRNRVGIFIQGAKAGQTIARIREAEQAGVQQIWMGSGGVDTLTLFAAAAARTERIRLGTAIAQIYPRHPLEMARQALAIDDIAPGRLRLGIGVGNRAAVEEVYGLPYTSPLSYLKEYLEVVRRILWEESLDYQGTFFHMNSDNVVAATVASLLHKAQIPLPISALGEKAFRLAGEVADGAISWLCPVPYLLSTALPALRAGAEARGRAAPSVIAHVQVALSADEETGLAAAVQRMQRYTLSGPYARMFVKAGYAKAVEGDKAEREVLAKALTISGDEGTIRARIRELLASGLDELVLQLIPVVDEIQEQQCLFDLVGSL